MVHQVLRIWMHLLGIHSSIMLLCQLCYCYSAGVVQNYHMLLTTYVSLHVLFESSF